jgi:dolichyl-phosphate beta-glucosyltransferase
LSGIIARGTVHRLTVVIPAFNEVDRLPPTLVAILDHLSANTHWLPGEVVVVDDGSTDETAAAVRDVRPADEIQIEVVSHPKNLGKGAAVRTGFAQARGEQLLICDADLATPIDQLEVLRRAGDRASVRIGSRALDRKLIFTPQPLYRDLMGRSFNLIVRSFLLSAIHDTQCGFKLFPGELGRALALVQGINGFAYDVELLVLARSWGFKLHEVAVEWRHVEASRVHAVRHSSQMLRDLLRLWLLRSIGRAPKRPLNLVDIQSTSKGTSCDG